MDERAHEQGIAHVVEHVTFLGSRRREGLLGTGARSNAYTDFHHTVFHVHSPLTNSAGGDPTPMLPQVHYLDPAAHEQLPSSCRLYEGMWYAISAVQVLEQPVAPLLSTAPCCALLRAVSPPLLQTCHISEVGGRCVGRVHACSEHLEHHSWRVQTGRSGKSLIRTLCAPVAISRSACFVHGIAGAGRAGGDRVRPRVPGEPHREGAARGAGGRRR